MTSTWEYTEKVKDHFRNPRNLGELDGPDGVGMVGNPVCGDLITFQLKVKDEKIEDIRFRTFGCGAAIAVSSMLTEIVKGRPLEEAVKITKEDIANALDGLPPIKMHCSNLASDGFHAAIKDYLSKRVS